MLFLLTLITTRGKDATRMLILGLKAPYFTSEMRRGPEEENMTKARGKQLTYHRPLRTEISMCVRLEWNEETAQKRKLFRKNVLFDIQNT